MLKIEVILSHPICTKWNHPRMNCTTIISHGHEEDYHGLFLPNDNHWTKVWKEEQGVIGHQDGWRGCSTFRIMSSGMKRTICRPYFWKVYSIIADGASPSSPWPTELTGIMCRIPSCCSVIRVDMRRSSGPVDTNELFSSACRKPWPLAVRGRCEQIHIPHRF